MSDCAFRQVLIAVAAITLTACSGGKGSSTSQVVAKVNDREITVSQLSEVLATRGAEGATPGAARQALNSLIDEQLLAKNALDQKLDRDPAVMKALEQALEQTRRQVLARAYVERVVIPREPISAAERISYYEQHPELFEKRKVFHMMVYTITSEALPNALRDELGNARTVEDMSSMLAAHGLVYETQALNRGTEQLPLGDLAKFDAATVGDVLILPPQQGRVALMQILGIEESPIDVDRAQPIIQQYLVNTRNAKALEDHLRQARAAAKISYFDSVSVAATGRVEGQLK